MFDLNGLKHNATKSPTYLDHERLVWIKGRGIPTYAWTKNFFILMGSLYGDFLYLDDLSMNRERLDVAHFSIRTKTQDLINYVVRIKIDEDVFDIKLVDKGSEDCLKCIQGRNRKVH